MIYLRVKENTQQAKAFAQYAKTLDFVELIEDDEPKITKAQFTEDLKASFREVKQNKTKPLSLLLNGK